MSCAEFAVEVAEEEQRLLAQHREARIMHRADGIVRPEHIRHERGQVLRSARASAGDFMEKAKVKWLCAS